jgi:hypothetical protein
MIDQNFFMRQLIQGARSLAPLKRVRYAGNRITRSLRVSKIDNSMVCDLWTGDAITTPHGRTGLDADGFVEFKKVIPLAVGDVSSARNIVGSVVPRWSNGKLVGVVRFASDKDGQIVRASFIDGSRTSIRADIDILEGLEVGAGQYVSGFDGPGIFANRWRILHAIIV